MAVDLSSHRQVGEFQAPHKKIIRHKKNPQDKSTIVSIFPKEINERRYTIEPGRFIIPPGTYENPSILVVGSSSWWENRGDDKPILEVPVGSVQVANSVIACWANGLQACNMETAMPGLFWIPGEVSVLSVKKDYKEKLDEVKEKQIRWFHLLVQLADSLWARSNGNPLVISDEARLAARALKFENKPWLRDFIKIEMVPCHGCGTLKNPEYPICPSCKTVDPSHPKAKELKFAV